MKLIKFVAGFLILFALSLGSCTNGLDGLNVDPNGVIKEEASARYFITNPQYQLYAPDRYPYWRAHLIHADRYAGHFNFGHSGSWWPGTLGYSYSSGYTDASWDWLEGYLSGLDNYMKLTDEGGDFESELMYATGLILKGLYYQMFTDVFGEIPYSEAADPNITLPKFDTQKDIYKGIIADLDKAISIIGDAAKTGEGVQDLGDNDLYCKGDLQKWKKLANVLKLRIALRAYDAAGDDFAEQTITDVMNAGLFLESEGDNVVLEKDDEISQWGSACYGDVWWNFGGLGSKWTVGEVLVNNLRNYNDPRLEMYAKPAPGGEFEFKQPDYDDANPDLHDNFFTRVRYIRDVIADAIGNTDFYSETDTTATFDIPENMYYIGQPARLSSEIKQYARWEFFSQPQDVVVQQKNKGAKPFNELIFTSGESYLLRAQAAVLGLSSEDEQAMFENGIRQEMKLWGVDDGAIDAYLASSALADISSGTLDEKLEKIAIQRWIGKYTDGFEAWSIVRKTGYPAELAQGVSNIATHYIGGDLGSKYPQRLRYGSSAYNTNGSNVDQAVSRQGADNQATELWWAK